VTGHDGKLTQPACGVVNGPNWFAVCAASVKSVPPWPSAAATKLAAMKLPRSAIFAMWVPFLDAPSQGCTPSTKVCWPSQSESAIKGIVNADGQSIPLCLFYSAPSASPLAWGFLRSTRTASLSPKRSNEC
jgi:hypothetical protein